MSQGSIIRFRTSGKPRTGNRFSASEAYRAPIGSRFSTRTASRRGGEGRGGRVIRLQPPIDKDTAEGLATDYAIRLGSGEIARVKLTCRTRTHFWIDWVYVPPKFRGHGLAGRLLRMVLQDADAQGVRLSLEPRACAGLEQRTLEGWYEGYGFVNTHRKGDFTEVFTRTQESRALKAA